MMFIKQIAEIELFYSMECSHYFHAEKAAYEFGSKYLG
jgi:hypothetical protein